MYSNSTKTEETAYNITCINRSKEPVITSIISEKKVIPRCMPLHLLWLIINTHASGLQNSDVRNPDSITHMAHRANEQVSCLNFKDFISWDKMTLYYAYVVRHREIPIMHARKDTWYRALWYLCVYCHYCAITLYFPLIIFKQLPVAEMWRSMRVNLWG